jgi:ABC-type transporter Mla subunit MlaD
MDITQLRKTIEEARNNLNKTLDELLEQKATIDDDIDTVRKELQGLDAYLGGKVEKKTRGPRKTGIRQSVMNVISSNPNGINRSGILDMMNAKGDKKAEQAISNALASMKKTGAIAAKDGMYIKA